MTNDAGEGRKSQAAPGASQWTRVGLIVLAASSGIVGIWALIDPAGFFESFPGGGIGWVRLLPPYNEHLIRDVGALSLGNAALLAAAALVPKRQLLLAAVGSWLVSAVPHALFHVTHLDGLALWTPSARRLAKSS